MLGDALGELLTDFKKSSPDLITNIRTLGGGRNREIIAQVQAGRECILVLVKIMRNFTSVKNPNEDKAQAEGRGIAEIPDPEDRNPIDLL
jgi:hypothetical protein